MESVKSSLHSLTLPRKIKENLLRIGLIKEIWEEIVKDCKLFFSCHSKGIEGSQLVRCHPEKSERCLANAWHDRVGLSPRDESLLLPSPAFIEDDYLFVEAEEHYLLQHLRLKSHLICQKINHRLKEASLPPIKGIKTRLVVKLPPKPLAKRVHLQKPNLSSKDLQALLELCQSLRDTELRGLFLRLINTLYA